MDEDRLISLLVKGQEDAFSILIKRYQGRLLSIAYGITLDREESQEIVQEVFLKVFQKISTFKRQSSLSTWLHRITINQCLNWRRKWKRRARWQHQSIDADEAFHAPELASEENGPETLFRKTEFQKVFKEKLRSLPEDARAVFTLKELEGLSYDEIARIMKIKKGTVSSRLFYARKKIKKSLSEYLNGEETNENP
ncbi:RNA polymerase sigma factor [Thermodesulfobacteriota bacterium]